jgi:hypothetical protein
MAKRVLPDHYIFDPATKTVTIPNKVIPREQLLLVTNVSSNTVIFNFSDPDLKTTTYTAPYSSTGTQFVLQYNTASMSANDPLLILADFAEQMDISETLQDSTDKLRIAAPQSLIDTDFEYGLQPIKWESQAFIQNNPTYYIRGGGNSLSVININGGSSTNTTAGIRSFVTVTCDQPHGLTTGDIVVISDSNTSTCNGAFAVSSVATTTSFTFVAKGLVSSINIILSSTVIQAGAPYDINGIPLRLNVSSMNSDGQATAAGSYITVTTTEKHGMLPNVPILVDRFTSLLATGFTTSVLGSWTIFDVPTATTFRFNTPNLQVPAGALNVGNCLVAPRPEVKFLHRPSDGGVFISTGTLQEGIQAVRQTRRYFRYQSGKGLQMSTGTKFTPTLDVNTIGAVGTTATLTVQQEISMFSGNTIVVEGVEVNAGTTNTYNGTFTVTSANAVTRTIQYTMAGSPADTSPGGTTPQVTIKNWRGANIRTGMFDFQNGFFFDYDGSSFAVVRRTSVRELMGTVAATSGSGTITGTNTKFSKQVTPGDYIIIRGQSYQINAVDSDTSLVVNPIYRGNTISNVRANLTQNIRIPQSTWNIDKCDGTGPSGYNLDITKMQMCYIDYTWYGAGYVRFGFRGVDGRVIYVHKIVNNNLQTAAYMRSGNLPARYEVSNIGPYSRIVSGNIATRGQTVTSTTTNFVVNNVTDWPTTGQFMLTQGANTELCSYTGITSNSSIAGTYILTGITRGLENGGATSIAAITYTPTEYDGGPGAAASIPALTYTYTTLAPSISHWGTSVIMDGGFNDDKSIVFAYAKLAATPIPGFASVPLVSIRLAPSVDNSIGAAFGNKEIANRMQLVIRSIGAQVGSSTVQLLGILNPRLFTGATAPRFDSSQPASTWSYTSVTTAIGSGSLAQIIDHTSNTIAITGGEQIFGFVSTINAAETYDLGAVRDLGTSMISGDGSQRSPGYPNGPDILTIVARNISSTATSVNNFRISWTEAQA